MSRTDENSKLAEIKLEEAQPGLGQFAAKFVKNRQSELDLVRKSLEKVDYSPIAQMAHKWKGFSAPYGFQRLEKLARELEVAAKVSNAADCHSILQQIAEYLSLKKTVIDQENV